MRSTLTRAAARMSLKVMLLQGGLLLLVSLLSMIWLRVPDSRLGTVLLTVLLAFLVVAILFVGETLLLRRLAGMPSTRGDLLRGAVALLVCAALWFSLTAWLDHLSASDSLRAAYLHSRLPPGVRNSMTFPRLLRWLGWVWMLAAWLTTGLLAAIAVVFTQMDPRPQSLMRILLSPVYWSVLLLGGPLVAAFTKALLHWTPGRGLGLEATSLALRLCAVLLVDLVFSCYVLAVVTVLVQDGSQAQQAPAGTPEMSQSRTFDNP